MTKHIGPMMAAIVLAGVGLYIAQNISVALDGAKYAYRVADAQATVKSIDALFK